MRAGEENAFPELMRWLSGRRIRRLFLVRTSDTSKANFDAMRRLSLGTVDDPNVRWASDLGMDIVMPGGESLRTSLDVFRVQRRHVPLGTGKALLGYLIPSPDGQDVFVFILSSAAEANVEHHTGDRNAFTQLLCALIDQLTPDELLTPLLTRVIRDSRWAGQIGASLKAAGTTLTVNGTEQRLSKTDDIFLFEILCGVAAKDRRDIIERLGGIVANIRSEGQWYGGENLLPFTWRYASEWTTDPQTGERTRTHTSRHELEVAPRAKELLREFVRLATNPTLDLAGIGVGLGELGIVSRAPKHKHRRVTLDQLANPASGARSLLQPEWIDAWRRGVYETVVEVHEDSVDAVPTDAELVRGADGRLYQWTHVVMPAPKGGWGITEEQWDAVIELRLSDTPQGRARRNTGDRCRPLAGIVQYREEDRQWRLATFESGPSYMVMSRPVACSTYADGTHVSWRETATHNVQHASLLARQVHAAVADGLEAALLGVESRQIPVRPARAALTPSAETLAAAEKALATAGKLLALKRTQLETNTDPELSEWLQAEVDSAEGAHISAERHLASLRLPMSAVPATQTTLDSIWKYPGLTDGLVVVDQAAWAVS